MLKRDYRVGILGLGYVGTPLLNDILDKKIKVVGYDNSLTRINSFSDNYLVGLKIFYPKACIFFILIQIVFK